MPTVRLNKEEIALAYKIRLNSIKDQDFRNFMYRVLLLLDKDTGEIEIPGEMWDEMRDFAFSSGNTEWERFLVAVFGRTLGKYLDLGFSDNL